MNPATAYPLYEEIRIGDGDPDRTTTVTLRGNMADGYTITIDHPGWSRMLPKCSSPLAATAVFGSLVATFTIELDRGR